jgi:hypothetical protein
MSGTLHRRIGRALRRRNAPMSAEDLAAETDTTASDVADAADFLVQKGTLGRSKLAAGPDGQAFDVFFPLAPLFGTRRFPEQAECELVAAQLRDLKQDEQADASKDKEAAAIRTLEAEIATVEGDQAMWRDRVVELLDLFKSERQLPPEQTLEMCGVPADVALDLGFLEPESETQTETEDEEDGSDG